MSSEPQSVYVTLRRTKIQTSLSGDEESFGEEKFGPFTVLLYRRNPNYQRNELGPGTDTLSTLIVSFPENLPQVAWPRINDLVDLPACPQTGGVAVTARIQQTRGYESGWQCDLEVPGQNKRNG